MQGSNQRLSLIHQQKKTDLPEYFLAVNKKRNDTQAKAQLLKTATL